MGARRFAIIGHRAISSGRLPLNDLAGQGGRMDVIVRAVNTALFLSHGIRSDSDITLHLMGGSGAPRRIWFEGARLRGMHADERSIAGQIGKILREPIPPVGHLRELSAGMWHSGGDVSTTITEWNREGVQMLRLDAESQRIWKSGASIVNDPTKTVTRGFFLSDDRPFSTEEIDLLEQSMPTASLGDRCIQGHAAIAVLHQLLDWNVPLSV